MLADIIRLCTLIISSHLKLHEFKTLFNFIRFRLEFRYQIHRPMVEYIDLFAYL